MNNKYITMAGVSCGLMVVLALILIPLSFARKDNNKYDENQSKHTDIVVEDTQENQVGSEINNDKEPSDEDNTIGEQSVEETPKPIYSEEDLFNLAAAVCNEAGGSSEEIQLLVANVIINRVNSKHYPDTIEGVLTQKSQYGMMWKYGISFPKWATKPIKDQCYSVAKRILEGERVCPENVVYQAEFKQGTGVFKEYPGFYFCYRG